MVPRPDSIETFLLIMPMGFNPEAAGDTRAVIQFNFTGEVKGSCHLKIEKGADPNCRRQSRRADANHRGPLRGLDGHHEPARRTANRRSWQANTRCSETCPC